MCRIIAISNQKGGVGKTTTTINIGTSLAKLGKKVLLVDLDPQGNCTRALGIDKFNKSISDVLVSDSNIKRVIKKTVMNGCDVIPSDLSLALIDSSKLNNPEPHFILRNALKNIEGKYDFILIDCPPSLGFLNKNALAAAHKVLIPVQCEFFALEGVTQILATIRNIKNEWNPQIEILGFIISMYDSRNRLSVEIASELRSQFKDYVFVTVIPRNISIPESQAKGIPTLLFRPNSVGSVMYIQAARELLDRERIK
ncbi:MAG: ParA family protein [Firmicutes bacterium]|nr:ParA family protein [Candidatus Alectryobacillus merdavium]